MWTISAANKKFDGPLGSYNGLTDVHLAHYFSHPSRKSLLKAAKLITENEAIVPEQQFKTDAILYEKRKKLYDILASAVIQNASFKEGSWSKILCNYLEDVSKMENVENIKVGSKTISLNSFRQIENEIFGTNILSEWLKAVACKKCLPARSTPLPHCFSSRYSDYIQLTNSKMKRSCSAKFSSPYTSPLTFTGSSKHYQNEFTDDLKFSSKIKTIQKNKKKTKRVLQSKSSTKISKVTIPDTNFNEDQCIITLYYHGHYRVKITQSAFKEDILICQQHCGGLPITIYKGKISSNDMLSFNSVNHEGFSFSLTIFLDGIRSLKLSSCCVFRYPLGKRLGGSKGMFSIVNIEGGKRCLKCQYQDIEIHTKEFERLVCLEDEKLIKHDKKALLTKSSGAKKCKDSFDEENKFSKSEKEIDASELSVQSEVVNSINDEVEEKIFSPHSVATHESDSINEIIGEEENDLISDMSENNENISVDEEIKDGPNSASTTSNLSVHPMQDISLFQRQSFDSSSSEDGGGKQHVVLASVHGSPN